jgi:hypothetical protein
VSAAACVCSDTRCCGLGADGLIMSSCSACLTARRREPACFASSPELALCGLVLFFGGWTPANALFLAETAVQWHAVACPAINAADASAALASTQPRDPHQHKAATAVELLPLSLQPFHRVDAAADHSRADSHTGITGNSVLLALANSVALGLLSAFQVRCVAP